MTAPLSPLLSRLRETMPYPLAQGLPELRAAVAAWCGRRFGVELDPDREVIPTLGSKEAIYLLAQMVIGERRSVVVPEPAYPVYERGALFAGGSVVTVPLLEENGFLPDLGAIPADAAIVWGDEEHVEAARAVYQSKREVFLQLFARKGIRVAGSQATMYMWFAVPGGESSEAFSTRLLERGVVVSPGSYFGAAGERYARLALVPTLEDCRRAAALIEELL